MEAENNPKQADSNKPLDEKDVRIHFQAIEMGLDVQNKTTEQLEEEISLKIGSEKTLPIEKTGV